MTNSDPLIICESLIKVYSIAGLEVQALQGLDLTVAPGELMGIVGASGSGKSTLLNILGGQPELAPAQRPGDESLPSTDGGFHLAARHA